MVDHGLISVRDATTIELLEAVADEKGIEMSDIKRPLAEVIDPDCLEALWKPINGTERNSNGVWSRLITTDVT